MTMRPVSCAVHPRRRAAAVRRSCADPSRLPGLPGSPWFMVDRCLTTSSS